MSCIIKALYDSLNNILTLKCCYDLIFCAINFFYIDSDANCKIEASCSTIWAMLLKYFHYIVMKTINL